jgi:2-keto-3-deoxy-L-arabinonate dehydratase
MVEEAIPVWLTGVLPVLPTPFTAGDEVDGESLKRVVDFAAACGVQTVVTPAFGSEFYKLDGAERQYVIGTAVARARERGLRVVVQCNHPTPRLASRMAGEAAALGAAAVATALPRAFAASENQLAAYARRVCEATDLPVIVQDWYPGGRPAGAGFFLALHEQCPNFRLAKLEEPDVGETIRTIHRESGGRLGVLSGWGGSYAIQLHDAGVRGLMPGLALADVFVAIWRHLEAGEQHHALESFSAIAPYLQFSLQTFEQFHHAEKRLLAARGVLPTATVRPVTVELAGDEAAYLDLLIAGMGQLILLQAHRTSR